jgi:Uma2 family endonuclease
MVITSAPITAAEFDELARSSDHPLEFVGGEVYEVVSNWDSSEIAMSLGSFISAFVRAHGLGKVTGADGGYKIGNERYIPDVAFVKQERLTDKYEEGYFPVAPDLAVEVLSPSDSERKMRIKIANYLQAGTVVWLVNPAESSVEVYVPGKQVEVLNLNGTLDGDSVLPGFRLEVKAFLS